MNNMLQLKNYLDIIEKYVPAGSKVAYWDIPLYLNVGDIFIYKGTECFMKKHSYDVVSRLTKKGVNNFIDSKNKLSSDTIILMQGGGNFGDLYPSYQAVREKVLEAFPLNKVIFLPQTVHFDNREKFQASAEKINNHKDVTIFVRDTVSAKLLSEKVSCTVLLCPDMAHALWDDLPKQFDKNKENTLWLIRDDKEKTDLSSIPGKPQRKDFKDWSNLIRHDDRAVKNFLAQVEDAAPPTKCELVATIWESYTDRLVDNIIQRLISYKSVVTSRMHGQIICALLDIESQMINNSYGKNSRYYNTWLKNISSCSLIDK